MTTFKTILLTAAATLGFVTTASADPSAFLNGPKFPRGGVENHALDFQSIADSIQVKQFQNTHTGRNYTAIIQTGRFNGLGVVQSGRGNTARVVQRGKNTRVVVRQNGNHNHSSVIIVGH